MIGPVEREELRRMAELGLASFETLSDCARRQIEMLDRLARRGRGDIAGEVSRCSATFCAEKPCKEGCHFGTRRRRLDSIASAYALLQSHPGPIHQVTVVHPNWSLPVGGLSQINIPAMRQWNYRVLSGLEIPTLVAVGICEVSLNRELDGSEHWAGEIQQIVAGATHEELKAAFSLDRRLRRVKNQKPVVVSDVANLGAQLGYAQKRFVEERRAYISPKTGRQDRRHLPLMAKDQTEFDSWLLGLPLGARTVCFGCSRRGSTFFATPIN